LGESERRNGNASVAPAAPWRNRRLLVFGVFMAILT